MKVKVESIEANVAVLEIEVDNEQFKEGLKKAYLKNKNHFAVPGFRKGKAPMNIITRHYGEEVLYEDAINEVCPEAYDAAIKQENLDTVDRPEIEIKTVGSDKDLVFLATVTLKPEVTLGEYKGISIEEREAKVVAADINAELNTIQERNARLIPVEDRGIENGDTVNIDFEGFKDGIAFDGGKSEGHNLEIGSKSFIPGFEEKLIGKNKGDEFDIDITFPEEYQEKSLAGQLVIFKIRINDIKIKELPKLDDDFAQDISEFDTLPEYKADIKRKLLETKTKEENRAMENEAIEKVVENATVEVPKCMIDRRVESLISEFDMTLRYQGMNIDSYLSMVGITKIELGKRYEERAKSDVKAQLVLEAISKKELIEATDEDFSKELSEMAESYKRTIEDIEKTLTDDYREDIKAGIVNKKTIVLLIKEAKKVKPVEKPKKDDVEETEK